MIFKQRSLCCLFLSLFPFFVSLKGWMSCTLIDKPLRLMDECKASLKIKDVAKSSKAAGETEELTSDSHSQW